MLHWGEMRPTLVILLRSQAIIEEVSRLLALLGCNVGMAMGTALGVSLWLQYGIGYVLGYVTQDGSISETIHNSGRGKLQLP